MSKCSYIIWKGYADTIYNEALRETAKYPYMFSHFCWIFLIQTQSLYQKEAMQIKIVLECEKSVYLRTRG